MRVAFQPSCHPPPLISVGPGGRDRRIVGQIEPASAASELDVHSNVVRVGARTPIGLASMSKIHAIAVLTRAHRGRAQVLQGGPAVHTPARAACHHSREPTCRYACTAQPLASRRAHGWMIQSRACAWHPSNSEWLDHTHASNRSRMNALQPSMSDGDLTPLAQKAA